MRGCKNGKKIFFQNHFFSFSFIYFLFIFFIFLFILYIITCAYARARGNPLISPPIFRLIIFLALPKFTAAATTKFYDELTAKSIAVKFNTR